MAEERTCGPPDKKEDAYCNSDAIPVKSDGCSEIVILVEILIAAHAAW